MILNIEYYKLRSTVALLLNGCVSYELKYFDAISYIVGDNYSKDLIFKEKQEMQRNYDS